MTALARIAAAVAELSALSDAIAALHTELSELRDELRTDDPRQIPLELEAT